MTFVNLLRKGGLALALASATASMIISFEKGHYDRCLELKGAQCFLPEDFVSLLPASIIAMIIGLISLTLGLVLKSKKSVATI